ncbi:hypothetical protein D3C72_2061420 [compost metagenome]
MGSKEARNRAKMAGPLPMPRMPKAMARTARGGMVLPMLKNCMKRSARPIMDGRLRRMPAGMPTTRAASMEARTRIR